MVTFFMNILFLLEMFKIDSTNVYKFITFFLVNTYKSNFCKLILNEWFKFTIFLDIFILIKNKVVV